MGHRQVAGQDVVERGHVGRSLDRRVAAQRHDPASRPADVAEQQLNDRSGADVLHSNRVLGPTDGVDDRAGALPPGVVAHRLGDLEELLGRAAADLGHQLGCVAAEVSLEDLEDAALVLQRLVFFRGLAMRETTGLRSVSGLLALRAAFGTLPCGLLFGHPRVMPGARVVDPLVLVEAREEPVEILGVTEPLVDDHRCVRITLDVLVEPALVLDDVANDSAEKGDVCARTDRDVLVGHRARPREARVDVHDLRAAEPRFHHPLEADRMVLGHVRAHDQDRVGVPQILLVCRGTPSPERGPQTGDRGAVSYACLVFDLDDAEADAQLLDQVVLLVVEGCAAQAGDAHRAVELVAVRILVLPGGAPGLDHALRDHLHRLVEAQLLPGIPVRPAVLHPQLAAGIGDERLRRRAFGTEPPAGDRARRIAFDLTDRAVLHVDELTAPDGAVRTDRLDDAVRVGGSRAQLFSLLRADGTTETERVTLAELA